jgi:hypothetical protein
MASIIVVFLRGGHGNRTGGKQMDIGRKIYYEKANGIVIWDKGEMSGDVRETTFEEDKNTMPILTLIDADQLGVKQLNYGELASSFQTCKGYRINPITEEVQFVS